MPRHRKQRITEKLIIARVTSTYVYLSAVKFAQLQVGVRVPERFADFSNVIGFDSRTIHPHKTLARS